MKLPRNITEIIDELIDQYLEEDRYNRPWIIGFSGGKTISFFNHNLFLHFTKI